MLSIYIIYFFIYIIIYIMYIIEKLKFRTKRDKSKIVKIM